GAREGLRREHVVYETVENFGDEPIRMISVPLRVGAAHYAVQVAGSLDDARAIMHAARWLFFSIAAAILAALAAPGALLARRALLPTHHIASPARPTGEASLPRRPPHPGAAEHTRRQRQPRPHDRR